MARRWDGLRSLTTRQRTFVYAYVATGGSLRQALAQAGYRNRVPDLRHLPHVRDAIRAEIRDAVAHRGITPAAVVAELATLAFSPVGDPEVTVGEKTRALVWLGKHLGLFTEKVELTRRTKWEVEVDLSRLPDEELLRLEETAKLVRLTRLDPERALAAQNGS